MNFHPLLWTILLGACHLTRAKHNRYEGPPTLKCPGTKPTVLCPHTNIDACHQFCDTLLKYEDAIRSGDNRCLQSMPIRHCPFSNGVDCMMFCSKGEGNQGPPIKAYLYSAYDTSLKGSIEFTQVSVDRVIADMTQIDLVPYNYPYTVMMLYPPESVDFGCRITGPPLHIKGSPVILDHGSASTYSMRSNFRVNITGVLGPSYTISILGAIVVLLATSLDRPHPFPLVCGKILADAPENEYLSAWHKWVEDENKRMALPPAHLPLLTDRETEVEAITYLYHPSDKHYMGSILYNKIDEHSVELLLIPSNNEWNGPMYFAEIWDKGNVYPTCARVGDARNIYISGSSHKQVFELTPISGFKKPIFGSTSHILSLNPTSWYYIMDCAVVIYALDSEPANLNDVVTPADPFACGHVQHDDGAKNDLIKFPPMGDKPKVYTEGGYFLETVLSKMK